MFIIVHIRPLFANPVTYNQNICYILTSCVFLWENWQGPHENMMQFELLIQKMQRCDQNYNYIIYIAHDNTHACINTSYMCNNMCHLYMHFFLPFTIPLGTCIEGQAYRAGSHKLHKYLHALNAEKIPAQQCNSY